MVMQLSPSAPLVPLMLHLPYSDQELFTLCVHTCAHVYGYMPHHNYLNACLCFKIWHQCLDFAFRDFVYRLNAENINLNVSQFNFLMRTVILVNLSISCTRWF